MKFFILSIIGLSCVSAQADPLLELNPQKCVALKQGNICYQQVKLIWSVLQKGNYCVVEKSQSKELKCWNNASQGSLDFEFAQDKTEQYALIDMDKKQTIAQQKIEVKWVYKNRRNSGWRVF